MFYFTFGHTQVCLLLVQCWDITPGDTQVDHALWGIKSRALACKIHATTFEPSLWHLYHFKHYSYEIYLYISTSHKMICNMSSERPTSPGCFMFSFPSMCQINERKQKLGLTPKRVSFLAIKSFLSCFTILEFLDKLFYDHVLELLIFRTQVRMLIQPFFVHYSVATIWVQILQN